MRHEGRHVERAHAHDVYIRVKRWEAQAARAFTDSAAIVEQTSTLQHRAKRFQDTTFGQRQNERRIRGLGDRLGQGIGCSIHDNSFLTQTRSSKNLEQRRVFVAGNIATILWFTDW